MHPTISRTLCRSFHALRRYPLFRHLAELEETQWWPEERLRELQLTRLRAILQHAGQHVPYYRDLFRQVRFDPRDVQHLEDVSLLPILTKAIIREHETQLMDERLNGRANAFRQTSGSTGRPLRVLAEPATRAAWWAAKYRGHGWHGLGIGTRTASIWRRYKPGKDAVAERIRDWLHNDRVLACNGDVDARSAREFYQYCLRYRPKLLCGYPSAVNLFAQRLEGELKLPGEALGLERVLTAGESLLDDQAERLRRVFGCPVIQEYGCMELGVLAFMCEQGTYHLTAEHDYVEAIPLDQGQGDQIIVTGLLVHEMPLIRYQLGDEIILGRRRCGCGRELPVLERVVGRITAYLHLPDGRKVSSYDFVQLLKKVIPLRGIQQVRFIQEELTRVIVEIAADGGRPVAGAEQVIRTGFEEFAGTAVGLDFKWVNEIPPEATGKRSCFVSKLNQAQHIPVATR